jgi:hypothetical protein
MSPQNNDMVPSRNMHTTLRNNFEVPNYTNYQRGDIDLGDNDGDDGDGDTHPTPM